jgi:aminoglycoside phosphotransferase (APT) family kinase protein
MARLITALAFELYAQDGLWRGDGMISPPNLDRFVTRIRRAFPALAFEQASLNDLGEDHVVVILDDAWIFRFPRAADYRRSFGAEIALLAHLQGRVPLATPDYSHLSPEGDFGGYRMIKGIPLTAKTFDTLTDEVQDTVLEQVAGFLRGLHGAPPILLTRSNGERARAWTGADHAANYRRHRRQGIAALAPASQIAIFDRFYDAYAALAPLGAAPIHGDLTDDHLLLAPDRRTLAGVIDFGDAAVGDPALDLAFFWLFGDAAASSLIARYDPAGADPTLANRSRFAFVRWRIERIWRAAQGEAWNVDEIIADLPRHFAALSL